MAAAKRSARICLVCFISFLPGNAPRKGRRAKMYGSEKTARPFRAVFMCDSITGFCACVLRFLKFAFKVRKNQCPCGFWSNIMRSTTRSAFSISAKLTISKKGVVTVKKGTKKGTYKIKVNVKAAGNVNYKAVAKVVTVTVKVK